MASQMCMFSSVLASVESCSFGTQKNLKINSQFKNAIVSFSSIPVASKFSVKCSDKRGQTKGQVSRTCKNCKIQFNSSLNHPWACRYHTAHFGGETRRKNSVHSGGTMNTPESGQNESKSVLDAFFLGKALAEALSERIESTVGEFLSTVGRVQAEQQKQVQEFQDEVLERANRAKEVAAREAMEAQGIIPKSSTVKMSTNGNGVHATSSSAWGAAPPQYEPPAVPTTPDDSSMVPSSSYVNDPIRGVPIED